MLTTKLQLLKIKINDQYDSYVWSNNTNLNHNSTDNTCFIFIHGLAESPLAWEQVAVNLSNYQTFIIIRPGYNPNNFFPKTVSESIQFVNLTIANLVKVYKLKKIVLIGHSLGSYFVLNSPKVGEDLKKILIAPFFKLNLPNTFLSSNFSQKYSDSSIQSIKSDFFLYKELSIVKRDIKTRGMSTPILIIRPQYDKVISMRQINKLRNILDNSCLVYINNSGHNVITEKPAIVAKQILNFTYCDFY